MVAISVLRAERSDIPDLAVLFDEYRSLYGCHPDASAVGNFLAERIDRHESIFLLARAPHAASGFLQLIPIYSSVTLKRGFLLNDLYVRRDLRRKGVGKALLAAAAKLAVQSGASHMMLSTESSNEIAQALYRSAGWQRDDRFYFFHLPVAP